MKMMKLFSVMLVMMMAVSAIHVSAAEAPAPAPTSDAVTVFFPAVATTRASVLGGAAGGWPVLSGAAGGWPVRERRLAVGFSEWAATQVTQQELKKQSGPSSGFDRVISDLHVAETNRHMAVTARETSGVRTVAPTYLGIMI
ncbi:hypothetical protein R6Q57_017109 [Mikania cordata]